MISLQQYSLKNFITLWEEACFPLRVSKIKSPDFKSLCLHITDRLGENRIILWKFSESEQLAFLQASPASMRNPPSYLTMARAQAEGGWIEHVHFEGARLSWMVRHGDDWFRWFIEDGRLRLEKATALKTSSRKMSDPLKVKTLIETHEEFWRKFHAAALEKFRSKTIAKLDLTIEKIQKEKNNLEADTLYQKAHELLTEGHHDEANLLYEKAKKNRVKLQGAEKRISELEEQKRNILTMTPDDLLGLESQKSKKMPFGPTTSTAGGKKLLCGLKSFEWGQIAYGRSALENEYVTFKWGSPNDCWLHTRLAQSSHVVIKMKAKGPPSLEHLICAGKICVENSSQKKGGKVEVVYTPIKYVRKVKGAGPGKVTYSREKSLLIDPD